MLAPFLLAASLLAAAPDPTAARADPWSSLRFLVGAWEGVGGGEPGSGGGRFSFAQELGGRVLVRRAHSAYASEKGRVTHDDLMVLHEEGGEIHARYWDDEGHLIDYAVTASADGRTITFLSASGKGTRFRLVYARLADDRVRVSFAIAPPGQPEAFRIYVEGESRRTGP